MASETVCFVHISDTHIGNAVGYSRHGHIALPCAQRLVDIINNLPVTPDFVMHTGDMVTDPYPKAFQLAAETFAGLQPPVYFVNGNHDSAREIKQYFRMGPREDLTAVSDILSYTFECKGYRFLVLDARGPTEIDPQGLLSEAQLAVARQECQAEGPPLVVFVHYPTVRLNSPWMDKNMLIQNGEELHQVFRAAGSRLRGVFSGHVHRSMQTVRDGVLYVAVGSAFSQFSAWPDEEMISYDFYAPPAFNFVQLLPEQMIVQQHTFPRV